MNTISLNASDVEIELANVKQNSMIAINAFHEYVSNSLTKVKDFLRDDVVSSSVISLAVPDSDSEATVMAITKDQYIAALNDLDGETTLIDSAGNEHVVSNDELTNIIMDTTGELAVQKEYLGCCLSGVQFTATDMLTRVKSLFPGVTGEILAKYSALIDNSSVINSISNLFQLNKFVNVDKDENDVIKVYTTDGYTGANVWTVVLQQIGDQLSSFFEHVVWEGITKIGDFFKSILKGLKDLALWLVGRVCSQLLTNYSKASSNIGIIDFPITQVCLGTIESLNAETGDFILNIDCLASGSTKSNFVDLAGDAEDEILSRNHVELHNYTSCKLTGHHNLHYKELSNEYACGYDSGNPTGMWSIYASYIYNMAYAFIKETMMTNNKEGIIKPRPVDVTIPSADIARYIYSKNPSITWDFDAPLFDITLRFGLDDNNQVWMQVFACDTYDHLHSFTDKQNYARMISTFSYITLICGFNLLTIPNIDINNYAVDLYYTPAWWYGSTSTVFNKLLFTGTYTDPDEEETYDLVGALHSVNMMSTLYNNRFSPDSVDAACKYVHRSTDGIVLVYNLLSYALYNSKCHELNLVNSSYTVKLKSDIFNFNKEITLPSIGYSCLASNNMNDWQDTSSITLYDFDYVNYFNNWNNNVFQTTFVPYQKSELVPVSIHYQTLDEQATEIRHAIIAVIIAAALIYISYKIVKFNKNRKIKTQLAQAAMDQYSWDFAKDPSEANFKKFTAARKKYKKMSLMNNVLGVSSSAAIESTSSNFDSLFQNLKGIQNGSESDSVSIKSLQKLIQGS